MKQRWFVSPEVAGELGEGTDIDNNVHPPRLTKLHHRFEGWMGDDIIECFPAFLVTQRLAHALINAGLTGFSLREVEVSVSPEFEELHPDLILPEFYWLAIDADAQASTDFRIGRDLRLEVTDRALAILKNFCIEHASMEPSAAQ